MPEVSDVDAVLRIIVAEIERQEADESDGTSSGWPVFYTRPGPLENTEWTIDGPVDLRRIAELVVAWHREKMSWSANPGMSGA